MNDTPSNTSEAEFPPHAPAFGPQPLCTASPSFEFGDSSLVGDEFDHSFVDFSPVHPGILPMPHLGETAADLYTHIFEASLAEGGPGPHDVLAVHTPAAHIQSVPYAHGAYSGPAPAGQLLVAALPGHLQAGPHPEPHPPVHSHPSTRLLDAIIEASRSSIQQRAVTIHCGRHGHKPITLAFDSWRKYSTVEDRLVNEYHLRRNPIPVPRLLETTPGRFVWVKEYTELNIRKGRVSAGVADCKLIVAIEPPMEQAGEGDGSCTIVPLGQHAMAKMKDATVNAGA
jgi:hypothetical protein